MPRALFAILVALAVAAGVFAYVQHDRAEALRRQLVEITAARDAAQAKLDGLKPEADLAKENIARLTAERDAALVRSKGLPADDPMLKATGSPKSGGETSGKGMMAGFAKMFGTEEGKKMMRSQMNMGLKMQYGSLAKDLKLDPKVADQVFALLGDRQMAMSEAAFGAMGSDGMDDAAAKAMTAKTEALRKDYDEKLKTVLGSEGMAQLKDYERTLGDRMMLTMHEQQFAAGGSPLDPAQRDGLLQLMKDERMKTPPSVFDASNSGDVSKTMGVLRDDAAVEKWLKQEENYQQRVMQAATQALNPDQVNALRESFKQQLDMQRFGIKMSKEMFKPTGGAGSAILEAPAPPVPAK